MANLFPMDYDSNVVSASELQSNKITGYKQSIYFGGDFIRDGQNRLQTATGVEAWEQWCINCLSTPRFSCECYGTDFGIDTKAATTATTREEAEIYLIKEITEAILADPYKRTAYIKDTSFTWIADDSVVVNTTLVGIDDATIDIIATIGI